MNQTFNLKRFLRYTRFTVSMNRWYYGVLLVLFTIPATVLSLCGVAEWPVASLVATASLCLSVAPFADLATLGGFARQIAIPASWFEKLIVEVAARFWVLAIPFGIHAIGYAFGFNGISSVFADGFSLPTLAAMLIWTTTMFFCLNFNRGKGRNLTTGKDVNTINWPLAICMALQGPNLVNLPNIWKFSPTVTNILLITSAAFFMAALITFRRKRIK